MFFSGLTLGLSTFELAPKSRFGTLTHPTPPRYILSKLENSSLTLSGSSGFKTKFADAYISWKMFKFAGEVLDF